MTEAEARFTAAINELVFHINALVSRCANLSGDWAAALQRIAELEAKLKTEEAVLDEKA